MPWKTLFLLLFILVLGTFIYLKVQILGDPNSEFNRTTRYSLGKSGWLRTLLGLHSYGDARGEYLAGQTPFAVEVVRAKNTAVDEQILLDFAKEVQNYTGRNAILYDTELVQDGTLTEADLQQIAHGSRHHVIPGESNIFVIYAEDFASTGNEVGKTFNEYGIVLSDKRLRQVTSRYNDALKQYVLSTLLHEFGHQLGLEHNDQDGCIMNADIESPTLQEYFDERYTPTEFCDYELKQIQTIKDSIK